MGELYPDFIKVDDLSRLTVIASRITFAGLTRGATENSYAYKDYGVGRFGDLADGITFDFFVSAVVGVGLFFPLGLSNNIGNGNTHYNGDLPNIFVWANESGGSQMVGVAQYTITGIIFDQVDVGSWAARWYPLYTRVGGGNVVKAYSDFNRISLTDTAVIAGANTDTFRYLYGINSLPDVTGGASISGDVSNLTIVGGLPSLTPFILGKGVL